MMPLPPVPTKLRSASPAPSPSVVANAVAMFTQPPKQLGDGLLQLRAINEEAQSYTLAHELMALAPRTKFNRPGQEAVKETRLPPGLEDAADLEALKAAMAITLSQTRPRG
jgi:hypothetical protein